MATIIHCELPTNGFALEQTFDSVPELEFKCVRVAENKSERMLPLINARGASRSALESAFENDASVEDYTLLAEFGDERLYKFQWDSQMNSLFSETLGTEATILDVYVNSKIWEMRVLYPQRDRGSMPNTLVDQNRCRFDIRRVKSVDSDHFIRNGLTEKQIDTLLKAWRAGYFEVPRQIKLEELARRMGISHQALSERLRRGHRTLIEETIGASTQNPWGSLQNL